MVSPAQVKRFLAPLRERHPEFIYRHRTIYYRIGGNLVWGCYLDGTSAPGCLRPKPFVTDLLLTYIGIDWRGEFDHMIRRDRSRGPYYQWREPESHTEFADAFELDLIPKFNSILTLEDYGRHWDFPRCTFNHDVNRSRWSTRCVHPWYPFGIALGELEWARQTAQVVESRLLLTAMQSEPGEEHRAAYYERIMDFVPLVRADDREGMISLLREFRREKVRDMEIESYWTPEPFPIETMD